MTQALYSWSPAESFRMQSTSDCIISMARFIQACASVAELRMTCRFTGAYRGTWCNLGKLQQWVSVHALQIQGWGGFVCLMVWRRRALACCKPYQREEVLPIICRSGIQLVGELVCATVSWYTRYHTRPRHHTKRHKNIPPPPPPRNCCDGRPNQADEHVDSWRRCLPGPVN